MATEAVVGMRPHTGWAVAVAIAGDPPSLLDRRRVELIEPSLPRQMYHAAADAGEDAGELIAAAIESVDRRTRRELARVIAELGATGHRVTGIGVAGEPRSLPSVETILASHPLLHSAEGELYRAAVEEAAEEMGLSVTMIPPRELSAVAASVLGLAEDTLGHVVTELGRDAGPPWRKDHKEATLAALVARASAAGERRSPGS